MLTRFFSAMVGVVIFFIVILSDETMISVAICVATLMALFELYNCLGFLKKGKIKIAVVGFLYALFTSYFTIVDTSLLAFILNLFAVVLFITVVLDRKNIGIKDIASIFFLTFYISCFMSYICLTRRMPLGNMIVWAIFIAAWMTDSCAYFAGYFFGKNKLLPEVSPKKTVEGAIGGVIGCVVSLLIYALILEKFFSQSVNYTYITILGLCASVLSQFGDLAASVIKREFGVKDFGNIMPGHGGVLDRFDSVIFIAPFVYYFFMYFPII